MFYPFKCEPSRLLLLVNTLFKKQTQNAHYIYRLAFSVCFGLVLSFARDVVAKVSMCFVLLVIFMLLLNYGVGRCPPIRMIGAM